MISALALSLLLPAATPTIPPAHGDDPPIHLKLSHDVYTRGEHARVRVKTAQNGFLVVLRTDPDGHVRVLYPLNPEDSGAVRGGREFEIRGRGDREAFTVEAREGSGTVLAALSGQPFHFDDFMRGGHWDYRALAGGGSPEDAEATLLDLVERMTDGEYDYDVVSYTVTAQAPNRYYAGWYDPWWFGAYYPCYGCGPFYGPRFGFGATIIFGRPFRGHRWR
jgi:hypothetical protein